MDEYVATPAAFLAFKFGVMIGMGGGACLWAALTIPFINYWSGRCYDRGIRDAQKGWRQTHQDHEDWQRRSHVSNQADRGGASD